jgi:predicted nucleic acid-binding protein
MVMKVLAEVKRLFLDTSPFIYLVERHPAYLEVCRTVFERIDRGDITGISSVITLTEVLPVPIRDNNHRVEKAYRDILIGSRNFSLIVIDSDIAQHAAHLRAQYRLRAPDALQLAAALAAGCDAFLTNDRGLIRVTEVKILIVSDLKENS